MSWLHDIIESTIYGGFLDTDEAKIANMAEQEIVSKLLNLIEQSKDKSLPLTWLTGEIKKL